MLRATCAVVIAALMACADGPAADPDPEALARCPILDDGCPPETRNVCSWCFPVGAACLRDQTRFCARSLGWCSEEGVCRQICGDGQACPAGAVAEHEIDEDGERTCFCVPD